MSQTCPEDVKNWTPTYNIQPDIFVTSMMNATTTCPRSAGLPVWAIITISLCSVGGASLLCFWLCSDRIKFVCCLTSVTSAAEIICCINETSATTSTVTDWGSGSAHSRHIPGPVIISCVNEDTAPPSYDDVINNKY